MKPIYLLFAATFIFASCTQSSNATEKTELLPSDQTRNATENGLKTIRTAEAKTLLAQRKDLVILDVRTPQEYAGGHLKNAMLLNKNDLDFEAKLKALDKEKTYLVYCAVGGRSGQAAKMMQEMGFRNIYDATEGFNPLKDAGAAVE
ncbi:rhodanese-like domain-containing protein [Adhaeribacter soli]|uniref:Rhodanese-like domain-containing protein n=1 Tax=Adhaeribacter soli TaxID=2607655 RepID=A0A5N1IKG9_9BACT|nr:rhodanese-like domain-containing protein [Adhaeribacter soli]KAA9325606.1 rhodanese-like domain-containing protein [Adhaeribacter soli]